MSKKALKAWITHYLQKRRKLRLKEQEEAE
jgi:hypothetical protein